MSKHPVSEVVGRNVKAYREAEGLSAEQVAEALSAALNKEVQPYIVHRMEKGARPISVEELEALMDIFRLHSRDRLFLRDDSEVAKRAYVNHARGVAYRAMNTAIEAAKEFMRKRNRLREAIYFVESSGVELTHNEQHDYSEVSADVIWEQAGREVLLEEAGDSDPEYVWRQLKEVGDPR